MSKQHHPHHHDMSPESSHGAHEEDVQHTASGAVGSHASEKDEHTPHGEHPHHHEPHGPSTEGPPSSAHAHAHASHDAHPSGAHEDHAGHGDHGGHAGHDHRAHHQAMVADFRRRFWVSLVLTIPIILTAPLVQRVFGFSLSLPGDPWTRWVLSSIVFFFGGWPFLKGFIGELRQRQPGMMTLIALAITVAYVYSTAVVFGLPGKVFFWELASLIVVMLLGHWIEMRSVLGA